MTKNQNSGLKKTQDEAKQATLKKLQEAIDILKAENAMVTKTKLAKMTGLHIQTLNKQHVKDLFRENKVCQYKDREVIVESNPYKIIDKLESNLQKSNKQIVDLQQNLEDLTQKYTSLENDKLKLEEKYKTLLGKWYSLCIHAKGSGIHLGLDDINIEQQYQGATTIVAAQLGNKRIMPTG